MVKSKQSNRPKIVTRRFLSPCPRQSKLPSPMVWSRDRQPRPGDPLCCFSVICLRIDRFGPRNISAVASELLPWVIIGPIAGILADRLNRKFLLVGGYVLQAALVAMMPFATTSGQIYALIFLSSLPVPVSQIIRVAAMPLCNGDLP